LDCLTDAGSFMAHIDRAAGFFVKDGERGAGGGKERKARRALAHKLVLQDESRSAERKLQLPNRSGGIVGDSGRRHRLGLPDASTRFGFPRASAGAGSELGRVGERAIGPAALRCVPTEALAVGIIRACEQRQAAAL